MRVKNFLIPALLLSIFFGCNDEVKRNFPPVKVAVNDSNEVEISDSIYFILSDTLSNRISISTGINAADLFYSINNSEFSVVPNETITLQRGDSVFQFYFTRAGFHNSEIKTVLLKKNSQKFLDGMEVKDIVSDSNLSINMNNKSRGMIKVEVYSMQGVRFLQRHHFKKLDSLSIKYSWEDFNAGVYILLVTQGDGRRAFRIIKKYSAG